MDKKRWETIHQIVDTLLTLPEDKKESYLVSTCDGDEDLVREVRNFLDHIYESEKSGFLSNLAGENSDLFHDLSSLHKRSEKNDIESFIGKKVGNYLISDLINEGGMGKVYLGERVDGEFDQKVAIKFLSHRNVSKDIRLRFSQEKKILANLKHPNIAMLLDGGVLDNGAPYLIMEYIDGTPIDEYCNENSLNVEERLKLFKEVLSAIDFAHSNLIVHRDIKPSNILIDNSGRVKILDFGIAKLMDDDSSTDIKITKQGQRLWTPQFAAPEQILEKPPLIQTDIYALGTLLHLLLTNQTPFELSEKSLHEIEEVILNETPSSLLKSLSNIDEKEIQKNFSVSKASLENKTKKDLEAIVSKAMRKDPGYRYRSISEFAEDIENFEHNFPVKARKGSTWYRVSKFYNRHYKGLMSAGIILIIFFSTITWYTIKINNEKNIAASEANKSSIISNYLISIFNSNNPYSSEAGGDGANLSAKNLLDRGYSTINANTSIDPDIKVDLLRTIGQAYRELGEFDEARTVFSDAKKLHLNEHNTDIIKKLFFDLDEAELYLDQRYLDKADSMVQIASSLIDHNSLNNTKYHAAVLAHQALIEANKRKYADAKVLFKNSLKILRELGRTQTLDFIDTQVNYADVLIYLDELEEAEVIFNNALKYYEDNFGTTHFKVASVLGNLYSLYTRQSKFSLAKNVNDRSLEVKIKLLGTNHYEVATAYSNNAIIERQLGNYDEAEKSINEALRIYSQNPQTLQYAFALNNLAVIKKYKGELEASLKLYQEVLDLKLELMDSDASSVAITMYNLADLYISLEKFNEALPLAKEVIRIDRKNLGEKHSEVGVDLLKLAVINTHLNLFNEAERVFKESYSILSESISKDHYRLGEWFNEYGKLLYELNNFDKAIDSFKKSLEIQRNNYDENDTRLAEIHYNLGIAFQRIADIELAQNHFQSAWNMVADKPDKEVSFKNALIEQINNDTMP